MSDTQAQGWTEAIQTIEDWFRSIEADPTTHRAGEEQEEDGVVGWGMVTGSANVFITLLRLEEGTTLQVHSPILKLPPAAVRPAFFEEMLRLNATTLSGCCFAIDDDDEVIVITDRMTADMSVQELDELIQNVASYADHYDNILSEKFGAEMIGDDPEEE